MTARTLAESKRRGFTLTEMLVVLVIIFILMGLLMAAVRPAISTGKEVQIRNDISQLDNAIGTFKADYGIYPPTHLVIAQNYANAASRYAANNMHYLMISDSENFLKKMFPRWTSSPAGNTSNGMPPPSSGNNGTYSKFEIISGSQVLVFLLGGCYYNGSTTLTTGLGFSDDPANPFGSTTTPISGKKNPYFEFNQKNLVAPAPAGNGSTMLISNPYDPTYNGGPVHISNFPSFADPNGIPYAYMASKVSNDYASTTPHNVMIAGNTNNNNGTNKNGGNMTVYGSTVNVPLGGYLTVAFENSNTHKFIQTINPYIDQTGKFYHPQGYQIISAGADGGLFFKGDTVNPIGGFGPGGAYVTLPANANSPGYWQPGQREYASGYKLNGFRADTGYDDISNFSANKLGTP